MSGMLDTTGWTWSMPTSFGTLPTFTGIVPIPTTTTPVVEPVAAPVVPAVAPVDIFADTTAPAADFSIGTLAPTYQMDVPGLTDTTSFGNDLINFNMADDPQIKAYVADPQAYIAEQEKKAAEAAAAKAADTRPSYIKDAPTTYEEHQKALQWYIENDVDPTTGFKLMPHKRTELIHRLNGGGMDADKQLWDITQKLNSMTSEEMAQNPQLVSDLRVAKTALTNSLIKSASAAGNKDLSNAMTVAKVVGNIASGGALSTAQLGVGVLTGNIDVEDAAKQIAISIASQGVADKLGISDALQQTGMSPKVSTAVAGSAVASAATGKDLETAIEDAIMSGAVAYGKEGLFTEAADTTPAPGSIEAQTAATMAEGAAMEKGIQDAAYSNQWDRATDAARAAGVNTSGVAPPSTIQALYDSGQIDYADYASMMSQTAEVADAFTALTGETLADYDFLGTSFPGADVTPTTPEGMLTSTETAPKLTATSPPAPMEEMVVVGQPTAPTAADALYQAAANMPIAFVYNDQGQLVPADPNSPAYLESGGILSPGQRIVVDGEEMILSSADADPNNPNAYINVKATPVKAAKLDAINPENVGDQFVQPALNYVNQDIVMGDTGISVQAPKTGDNLANITGEDAGGFVDMQVTKPELIFEPDMPPAPVYENVFTSPDLEMDLSFQFDPIKLEFDLLDNTPITDALVKTEGLTGGGGGGGSTAPAPTTIPSYIPPAPAPSATAPVATAPVPTATPTETPIASPSLPTVGGGMLTGGDVQTPSEAVTEPVTPSTPIVPTSPSGVASAPTTPSEVVTAPVTPSTPSGTLPSGTPSETVVGTTETPADVSGEGGTATTEVPFTYEGLNNAVTKGDFNKEDLGTALKNGDITEDQFNELAEKAYSGTGIVEGGEGYYTKQELVGYQSNLITSLYSQGVDRSTIEKAIGNTMTDTTSDLLDELYGTEEMSTGGEGGGDAAGLGTGDGTGEGSGTGSGEGMGDGSGVGSGTGAGTGFGAGMLTGAGTTTATSKAPEVTPFNANLDTTATLLRRLQPTQQIDYLQMLLRSMQA